MGLMLCQIVIGGNKKQPDYVEHSAESTKAKRSVTPVGIAGIQCTGTVLMCL